MRESRRQFIREQGFPDADVNEDLYRALMFQPRIIGSLIVVGVLAQSPWLFLGLSAILWSSTFVPTHNPFDATYNHVVAYPRGLSPLGMARAPRRFAQGMAATVTLAIGAALLVGAVVTAWVLEGLLVIAVMAVVLRDFCGPAHLYYVLRGLASGRRLRTDPTGITARLKPGATTNRSA